mgnify:CR=1 FL=1
MSGPQKVHHVFNFNIESLPITSPKELKELNSSFTMMIAKIQAQMADIQLEQDEKIKRLKPLYFLVVALIVLGATFSAIYGKGALVSLLTWLCSLILGFKSLEATFTDNGFQKDEREAVRQISRLLKQRRS